MKSGTRGHTDEPAMAWLPPPKKKKHKKGTPTEGGEPPGCTWVLHWWREEQTFAWEKVHGSAELVSHTEAV
jgi:hypothetical protein